MDQPTLVAESPQSPPVENRPLDLLPASLADGTESDAFVVVIRDAESLVRWAREDNAALQWLEVHSLLGDSEVWRSAASIDSEIPIDVVVDDPAKDYAQLYRLVDVRNVRPVRITIPVRPGFLKALRLAASLQFPVRLLPGQAAAEVHNELLEAVGFYLRDPMVEAPVEYFHSALASMQTKEPGSLWSALEEDPAVYLRLDERGNPELHSRTPGVDPANYVRDHIAAVTETGECRDCPWLGFCGGYFKQPDPDYSCDGVLRVFEALHQAADELREDLSVLDQGNAKPDKGRAAS
jgi:hypothetical protein